MKKHSRRSFLKLSGGFTSGLLAATAIGSPTLLTSCAAARESSPFGLQLYTLRDVLPADPRGILKQVADFGYKQIESYEGAEGMFWGMGHKGFKSYMDELGMDIISTHCNVFEGLEKKADEAAAIGMEYLICPYLGAQETIDDYKEQAERFNNVGEICNKAGVKFAYHNHGYTYEKHDGVYPQDILMDYTDPQLVEHEMDIYWVATVGEDPAAWIRKYPNRFTLAHYKDRADQPLSNTDASCTLGTGTIDFVGLTKLGIENGMKYFIVEQENYQDTTPIDCVRDGAEYMRGLKLT
ncbi:MAG: sugar phosphate isomerase/epimerase [Balneolales bacterium]